MRKKLRSTEIVKITTQKQDTGRMFLGDLECGIESGFAITIVPRRHVSHRKFQEIHSLGLLVERADDQRFASARETKNMKKVKKLARMDSVYC